MSREKLQIRRAEYSDAPGWDAYIAANPDCLAYHLFAWKQAIEASYGFDCPYFLAEQNNRICGVLPTANIHFPMGKGQLVSLPYCDVGGILADQPETVDALFSYACEYALERKIPKIEIRQPSSLLATSKPDNFNANKKYAGHVESEARRPVKVRMLLDLPESSDALLAAFKSKLRSQIKKPMRDGLIARLGGVELLEDFYSVFVENMRALGSPVHSKAWLLSVLRQFGDRAKCGVVYMPGKIPAAAGIILCHPRGVTIPWASSLQKFNRFNPNMLLYWSFLAFAADNGYRFFDFGRSTLNEGTYRFKAQWGASPQPLKWEEWKRGKNGFYPVSFSAASTTAGRGRKLAEAVFRKMPTSTATFFGSRIRKYISL